MEHDLDGDHRDWESLRAELVQEAAAALVHGWDLIDDVSAVFAAAGDDNVTIQLGPDEDVVYVQARRDDDCWLVEAVSNNYLADHVQLCLESEQWLTDHGWTAPSDDEEDDTPNFWRVYDDPVDLDEMARNSVVAFISAYGATPASEVSFSPALPPQDDGDEEFLCTLEVHEGTGPLERAARIAALPAHGWLNGDALVAALPGELQVDRLAQLLIMFGPKDAAPVVLTGIDEFTRVDVDDHVSEDAFVGVVEAAEGAELDDSWLWFIDQAILRSPAARRAAIRHSNPTVRAHGHWVGTSSLQRLTN